VLLGLAFHVGLDTYHEASTQAARRAALQRDGHTCLQCREMGSGVVAHLWRQPRLLPSYRAEHFMSRCPRCHELAHALGSSGVPHAFRAAT